jgi:phage baseplate assembly protein W
MADKELEQEQLRERLLGWSAACPPIFPGADIGRDLVLTRSENGLDLAQVRGQENLKQALEIALTTLLGSDILNTQFGFDGLNALVEESNPVLVRERVRVALILTLQKDARITRIIDVKMDDGSGQLEFPSTGSRQLDVRVTFETISGQQMTVDTTKVALNG